MLREFGVKGVKVQEVVSLDAEMMGFLKYVPRIHASAIPANVRDQSACIWFDLFVPLAGR